VSPPLVTSLLLQVMSIALMRHRLGREWLRRPATLVVLASAVYLGLSPTLLTIPSIKYWDIYRIGVQQGFVNSAMLLMSAGMLAFTVTYLMTHPERAVSVASESDIRAAVKALDWRLLTLACAPVAILTYGGRGYNAAVTSGSPTPIGVNLASTFFVILVVLAAFSFVLSHGPHWFLPVLIGQSLLLAAAGERTPVVIDAIALILLLCHAGYRPPSRQLNAATGLTLIAILAITGVRADQGRSLYYEDSGLSARVAALGSGLAELGSAQASPERPGLIAQAAIRLDGVDFAGAILQSMSLGQPRLSASHVPESLLLAVPSAAWPSKLDHASALNPTQLEYNHFGLQRVNFLPTLPGLYFGFLSPLGLMALLACLGALCGWGERLLFRSWTPARMILLAGAATAALPYEKGIPDMLVALRSAVAIAVVIKLVEVGRLRRSRRAIKPLTQGPVDRSQAGGSNYARRPTAGERAVAE
jgi:hypothetical protein